MGLEPQRVGRMLLIAAKVYLVISTLAWRSGDSNSVTGVGPGRLNRS